MDPMGVESALDVSTVAESGFSPIVSGPTPAPSGRWRGPAERNGTPGASLG